MGTSIKRSIGIRVACAIIGVLLFSVVTTVNIIRIQDTQDASEPEQCPLRWYRVHWQYGPHRLRPRQMALQ